MAGKKSSVKDTNEKRPADYNPQPGNKATLTLADFTDENLLPNLDGVVIMANSATPE